MGTAHPRSREDRGGARPLSAWVCNACLVVGYESDTLKHWKFLVACLDLSPAAGCMGVDGPAGVAEVMGEMHKVLTFYTVLMAYCALCIFLSPQQSIVLVLFFNEIYICERTWALGKRSLVSLVSEPRLGGQTYLHLQLSLPPEEFVF